jgi:effector-binding domain-containing protein
MRKYMLWFAMGAVIIGAAVWGPIVSNVEQAKYDVVESHSNIEIRDYVPMIVAEVEVLGERKEAINKGFRMIADYIFGNNKENAKVAMTAPVVQEQSKKIAMTAPVTHQAEGDNWKVHFVMPASYTMEMLPKPNNPLVKLKEVEGKRFVAIRFSGIAGEESLKKNTEILERFITENGLKGQSVPIYAFFNPPWTLPFLRRNEVMIEIFK